MTVISLLLMRPAHNISPSYGYFWLLFYFQAELHNISTPTFVLLPPVLLYNEADIYFLLKVLAEYLVGGKRPIEKPDGASRPVERPGRGKPRYYI
jgi:hypothetical protein